MKKFALSIATMLAVSGAMAQGPYLTFGAGYAGAASQEQLGTNLDITATGTFTETPINGSYGGGIPISLSLGYGFTKHIAFDLGFNYFMGNEVTISTTKQAPSIDMMTTTKGYQIRIIPQLVISTGTDKALNLYSKFGIVAPVSGKTTFKQSGTTFLGLDGSFNPIYGPINVEGESTGKFSLGFTGSLGATFNLSDNLSIFGELQYINLRIKGDKQTLTKYEVNGVETIDSQPKSVTETDYVDQLTEKSNIDPTKPTEALRNSSNYNSLGLNIGIKFNF
jgi:opacity protein-like surface antigen